MTLYQISYVNGKPTYSLVSIKQPKPEEPPTEVSEETKSEIPSQVFSCEQCGLVFASEVRLNWHRSTHDPLKQRKAEIKQLKMAARHRYEDAGIVLVTRSPSPGPKSYLEEIQDEQQEVADLEEQLEDNDGGGDDGGDDDDDNDDDDDEDDDNDDDDEVEGEGEGEAVTIVTEEELATEEENLDSLNSRVLTFICPSCEFSTSERGLMIEHFTVSHCFKTSPNPRMEGDEEQDMMEEEEAEDERSEQVLQEFESIELTCSKCCFSSDNQDDLDFHTCLPSEEQMFSCHLCTYECLTRTGLQSHITRKHKPRPEGGEPRSYECDACDFKCTNKNTLYSHKRKHRPERADGTSEEEPSYFCNECDFAAKRKGSLYLHIQRRHKNTGDAKQQSQTRPNFYSCDQCDYTNKNKYEMKVHVIRKHTNEYNHECEICGKKYKIRGDLTNHIRFQHREQPIICDVCGKTCGNSNSLYVHQKFAHYKAEFECPICHRRMVSQANLDDHILKQHEQREDAVCEECGKTFSRQSRLKIHMRIHTGIKPHSCKVCGKAFNRKTALRQHLLIHTGQRPYVCDICGKAFTQKPGLISHRKSHPGSHPPLPRVTIDHVLSELLTEES